MRLLLFRRYKREGYVWWLLCVLTRLGKGKEEEERGDRGDLVAVLE